MAGTLVVGFIRCRWFQHCPWPCHANALVDWRYLDLADYLNLWPVVLVFTGIAALYRLYSTIPQHPAEELRRFVQRGCHGLFSHGPAAF